MPEKKEENEASREHILLAKKVVKSLRIKFDSRAFENPVLQRCYANLQALALDRDMVEETEDLLQPDLDGMSKVALFNFIC